MAAIANSDNFGEWFKKLGGSLASFDYTYTLAKTNFRELKFSSLKIDPKETKRKHNYKFKENEHY